MMKNKLIIIPWLFLLSCQPSNDKTEDEIELWLKEIYINQYEDDSLNRTRRYVIPRIYYVFGYDNSSVDSVFVELNSHFENNYPFHPCLYVLYNYGNEMDTLLITDYESVNPILLDPKTSSRFTVGVPISEEIEKGLNESETVSSHMKYIAENGVVFYNSPGSKDRKVLNSQTIKKSKDFRVLFRDPDDTTVE